jgi:tetratricopeptide (TPR) repeat protein
MADVPEPHDPADALFAEAVALHDAGQLAEAATRYQEILRLERDHFGALHRLGVLRAHQGSPGDALTLLGLAVRQNPQSPEAQNHLGSILHARQRYAEAIACFDQAIALDADYAEAHYNRGGSMLALGRLDQAIASYRRALDIDPDFAPAHFNCGLALQQAGRLAEAAAHYRRAVATEPGYGRARAALGALLLRIGEREAAIAHLEQALLTNPDDAEIHNNLGLALHAGSRQREAVVHLERAIAVRPGFAAAHNNLAMALQALDRHDEAIAHYRKAAAASPPQASRHANLGVALQEIGRLDEARQAFKKAIELAPTAGRFYRNLADCTRFAAADPEIAAMAALAREGAALTQEDRRQLLFALGKAFADIGQHDRAFACWAEGNALNRARLGYDEAAVLDCFARLQAVFDADLIAQKTGAGDPSPIPVFIVGMPRSGTTLVEQILASHSRVFGAGELLDFSREAERACGETHAPEFAVRAGSLSAAELHGLGARYIAAIRAAAPPRSSRITDKMPLNFIHLGLIHSALPNARIIHTRRDPIDTCFSCFTTLFAGQHRVAYELGELGRYYRAYEALMGHWRRVLPAGIMLDVRYEDIVDDLEPACRRILVHCGLEWEVACLDFHLARRAVRTASLAQVRRPIYRDAIGRWQPYAALLAPLLDALGVDREVSAADADRAPMDGSPPSDLATTL